MDELFQLLQVLSGLVLHDLLDELDGALRIELVGERHTENVDEVDELLEVLIWALLVGFNLVHLGNQLVEELARFEELVEDCERRADILLLITLPGDVVHQVVHERGLAGYGAAHHAD